MAREQPRIGRKLRRAMERKRLDQTEVAEALGVSRNAVNAWLNDRAYPQNSIGALEELLDISLDEEPPSETPAEAVARLEREIAELRAALGEGRGKAQHDEQPNGGKRASLSPGVVA